MALGTMLQEKHLGVPTWGWLGIGAGGMVFILLGRGGKKTAPAAQAPGVVIVGHGSDVGPPSTPPLGPPGPPGPPGGGSNQLDCDSWPFFAKAACKAAEQLGFVHIGKSAMLARGNDASYARDFAAYAASVNALPGTQRRDFFFNLEHPNSPLPAWYVTDLSQYGAGQ